MMTSNRNQPLSNYELPSAVFAIAPKSTVSSKYSFLPTIEVVNGLRAAGWMPVRATQSRVRDESNDGLQRHSIRFRHPELSFGDKLQVGDTFPELQLLNSHNGASSFILDLGIYRALCGNGMIVCDSMLAKLSVRHMKATVADVVDASFEVIKDAPRIGESIEAMRNVTLSTSEQRVFAESAALIRWQDGSAPIMPEQLNRVRRYGDDGADLWRTFNRTQEALIRGGDRGRNSANKRTTTRAVNSVGEDTRINKALWHLAEEMRKLKAA